MSLVACRACGHQVDTTAEACPGCGATNPGQKMSRQKRNLIVLLIQLIVGTAVVAGGATMVWNTVGPLVKQQLSKPAP